MTFDPFSHPGPSSGGARPRDSAAGGGRSGGVQSQAHRDPIAWAYDPSVQEGYDSHSRVDRPWAADHAADPSAGRPDPYDYGSAPWARSPYDYGSDPRVEDFYDDRPDPDYSRRGPRRTHRHRKLRTAARLFSVLMYARRLEASYYGPGPYGPAPYDYGPGLYYLLILYIRKYNLLLELINFLVVFLMVLREDKIDQQLLVPLDLKDLIPKDHLDLVKLKHIAIDGIKIKAKASINNLTNQEQIDLLKDILKKSIELDEEEDELLGDESGNSVPKELIDKKIL